MEAIRSKPEFHRKLVLARILTCAMGAGLFSFAAVVAYLTFTGVAPILPANVAADIRDLLLLVLAGVFLSNLVASFVVTNAIESRLVTRLRGPTSGAGSTTDPVRILGEGRLEQAIDQWFSARIVRMALFEGCGIFALIVWLMTGSPIAAGVALVTLLAVLSHFPGEDGLLAWLERIAGRVREPV